MTIYTLVTALVFGILQNVLPGAMPAGEAQSTGKADQVMTNNGIRHSPLACNAAALNPAQRQRVVALVSRFRAVQLEIREMSSGYAIRLPSEASVLHDAAEYITLERQCCPFFDFALRAEREGGPVWLILTGRDGVKELARIEFGIRQQTGPGGEVPRVSESPLACNDRILTPMQRTRLIGVLKEVRAAKQETRELSDGYAIRLPASTSMVLGVADYMSIVRLCSPYLETTLEVECEGGPAWLKITGREGVKELVKTELQI